MSLKKQANEEELRKTLGFINWLRPHLRNASERTKDLYEKKKKDNHIIEWNEYDDFRLEDIKKEY